MVRRHRKPPIPGDPEPAPLKPTITNPLGLAPANSRKDAIAPVDVPRAAVAGASLYTVLQMVVAAFQALGNNAAWIHEHVIATHSVEWAAFFASMASLLAAYMRDTSTSEDHRPKE